MKEIKEIFIPALRGIFGDWVYYSCLVPAEEIAIRVDYAKELNKSTKLSELMQREIKEGRGVDIAKYLSTEKERFFNSLVVAVYGGKPIWHEVGFSPQNQKVSLENIPDFALHSFGFLYFSGNEKLFAIDGQHRLAGIKRVVKEGKKLDDEISVIFVAHQMTIKGLQRTRRLFTTLNKTAIPVSKGEKIALDENDVMAIITRRLVEDNPKFSADRIAYKATNNLSSGDLKSLTTIGNLYDILEILFVKIYRRGTSKDLQFSRPEDKILDEYYDIACNFFELMQSHFPEIDEYFKTDNYVDVVKKHRGSFGGSLIFRPIGLTIILETIEKLSSKLALELCIKLVSKIPRDLAHPPFAEILWDTKGQVMINKQRVLARNLMLYMLQVIKPSEKLLKSYATALGKEVNDVNLPNPIHID
jgi:DNA sulfur modification protein DndB